MSKRIYIIISCPTVLLIFDLDGTIVDSWEEVVFIFSRVFERRGLKLDVEKLRMAVGYPLPKVIEKVTGFNDRSLENEIKEEFYSLNPRKIRMFPGVDKVLRYPSKKAVLTSKRRKGAIWDLKLLGIEHLFSIIVAVEDLNHPKPHPEGILKIIDMLDYDSKDVYYIGDTEVDILTAKNAGVKSIAVTWGFRTREFLEKYDPDYIVDSPEGILKIIKKQ